MNDEDEPKREYRESNLDAPAAASDDRLYRALASTSRRRLLWFLLEEGESTVDELATVLVGRDATDRETMRTPEDRERTVVDLVHVQLPLLAEAGLVAYDREGGTVRIERLDPHVRKVIRRSVGSDGPARP